MLICANNAYPDTLADRIYYGIAAVTSEHKNFLILGKCQFKLIPFTYGAKDWF